jgi:fucose permease
MGMKEDLQLKGNEFSNIATAFFVAYLVAELPMGEPRDTLRKLQSSS